MSPRKTLSVNGLPTQPPGENPGGQADGQTRGPDQRLGKSRRLTRSPQIRQAFDQQHKQVGRYMVLWLREGDDAALRVAVVASRKVGNAVRRAAAKRRLREVFRKNRAALSGAFDVVLVARADIIRASVGAIQEEFLALARRAGVYKPL